MQAKMWRLLRQIYIKHVKACELLIIIHKVSHVVRTVYSTDLILLVIDLPRSCHPCGLDVSAQPSKHKQANTVTDSEDNYTRWPEFSREQMPGPGLQESEHTNFHLDTR